MTKEEFIEEAKRRGYKTGMYLSNCKMRSKYYYGETTIPHESEERWNYNRYSDYLEFNGKTIYKMGEWAEIEDQVKNQELVYSLF